MRTKNPGKRRGGTLILIIALVICIVVIVWVVLSAIEEKSYPLEYTDEIARNAQEYGIDPYLVAAVIRTESGFDPDAVSRAGARGLMQLMPETGSWIAEKLNVSEYSDASLFDPSTNIEFGCWYLRFLQDKFDGNRIMMTAAYNAGHNRVSEWILNESIAPAGDLTNIPYEETSQYVQKVADAEEKYRALYPEAFGSRGAS